MRIIIRIVASVSAVAAIALASAPWAQRPVQAQAEIKPLISSFEPTKGVTAGGTVVVIRGSDFAPGAKVEMAGVPQPNATVIDPFTIRVVTVPNPQALGTVVVTNPDGKAGVSAGYFTYQVTVVTNTAPIIQSVTPGDGSFQGGTELTILGARFVEGITGTVSSNPAKVRFVSDSRVILTTPPGVVGTASISLINPNGEVGSAPAFSFIYTSATNPNAPVATPAATATPAPAAAAPVLKLPARGLGLMVFTGGNNSELVRVSGCPAATAAFWASDGKGSFVTYVPGTSITAVNAAWNAMFPSGAPAGTALIARCAA